MIAYFQGSFGLAAFCATVVGAVLVALLAFAWPDVGAAESCIGTPPPAHVVMKPGEVRVAACGAASVEAADGDLHLVTLNERPQ